VIGASIRRDDTVESTQAAFIAVAAEWCVRSGVDRDTLFTLGIDRTTLRRAGVAPRPTHELLRAWWPAASFTVADLARRSGYSEPTVRRALAVDERSGLLRRVATNARATAWERAD
jgi:hypothetical protein